MHPAFETFEFRFADYLGSIYYKDTMATLFSYFAFLSHAHTNRVGEERLQN